MRATYFYFPFLGLAAALQAANFDISPAEAAQHGCNDTCLQTYHMTQAMDEEEFRTNFDYEFYQTASNFSGSSPGDLLKLEPLDPTTMNTSSGTTVYRMQYTSKDLDGSPVPVTGFIAFPYTMKKWKADPLPSGPDVFRLVAWAHGTSGLYSGCAPSNGPTLYEGAWQALVDHGYAVVGTDYAGIGNNYTTHKFLSFSAQATDVYYSVVAAKKVYGHVLSLEWASIGHSQGGGVVWKLAEDKRIQAQKAGYLGTVALSPATYVVDMFLKRFDQYPVPGLVTVLPESIRRAIPSYNSTFLARPAQRRYELAEKAKVCFASRLGLTMDLTHEQVVDRAALERDMPMLEEWQSKEAPVRGEKSSSPILVMQGGSDDLVLPDLAKDVWMKSCGSGNEVHLVYYPGVGHTPLVQASQLDWMDWIDGLFDKGNTTQNLTCSFAIRRPFNLEHMRSPIG
ncbi:prolyl aminopeptidase (secreted protein) [Pochonia chlamydosporia 170]|uniref:Prolyl aminopeptidase (Secreted protein) n=1 Tax=Pochonia chlamydosporia 170 TaxID=1380566 RepID=A0A179G0X2_METCM|nr:prolyl aminopeptidase (secreted protein) [Pochonia chlamydosporia 170]OAQ71357.1 prolyl aminopeptidase (secreted protein) [Pochonia chlamydosporia 170]